VTSRKGDSGRVVELSHESLITGWGRLAGWLDDAHEALRFRDRVAAAAALWAERAQPADLLWTGRTLEAALEWRAAPGTSLGAGGLDFLGASEQRFLGARRVRRGLALGGAAAGVLLVAGLSLGIRASREAARAARARAIVEAAAGAKDPLTGALALLEL